MDNVLLTSSREQQLEQALTLLERFKQHEDQERVEKTLKLIEKIYMNETVIAFSGHFSAGKSTMINHLAGENILPSSPIPTSANIVKVHRAAEDFAKVYSHNARPLLFTAPYDFTAVQNYCKKGNITEVEIGRKDLKLPDGLTIMDTPGIDSTDEAHRLSTESALHIADAVFYVMDYNHVQSELNFIYTKNLLQHGVKLYLIINQIDKHNDSELSFMDFKAAVRDSFAAWNVEPEGIFYTTLKVPEHPHNQFNSVKSLIDSAMAHHVEWMEDTVSAAVHQLIDEHKSWLEQEKMDKAGPLWEKINSLGEEEISALFIEKQEIEEKQHRLSNRAQVWKENFEAERASLLKNAYLMPFEIRELAERFLESKQPDFKIGFFNSKKKTEEERKARLHTFAESLRRQVEMQIEWHLRELFAKKLHEVHLSREDLELAAQRLNIEFDPELLTSAIHKGAQVTGEYVLNYTEELASRLKRIAIHQSDPLKEDIAEAIEQKALEELEAVRSQADEIEEITNAVRDVEELEQQYKERADRLEQPTGSEDEILEKLRHEWTQQQIHVQLYDENRAAPDEERKPKHEPEFNYIEEEAVLPQTEIIRKLDLAVSYFSKEKGFERVTEQLRQKASRLKNNSFTIALFGAFSAGKSSFANAMLGEKILPVSPNPTTAAINRISPPNRKYKHGTAVIRIKDSADLLEDVKQSLQLFGKDCQTLDEAFQLIPNVLSQKEGEGKEKVHLSFLQAFVEGYSEFSGKLGRSIIADLDDFQGFVANESQSCFVEIIDLYYDCPITREGITLVDTPGADSINARHTGVAFDYIKNSDAILFVTYYNHAFSKADREFLIQLGRVKDTFELDKMFFIVNAIDLASSEEEVQEVLAYVTSQLTEYGIRFPRIFGLSSKSAQNPDTVEESRIHQFTQAFSHFLEHDLTKMAIQSAEKEYERAVQMLKQMIASASEDESKKAARKKELLETKSALNDWLDGIGLATMPERLEQEAEELVHFVKQRVFYRLPDFFKEAFNPAEVQTKDSLTRALDHYLNAAGFDFAQELRATSLRVELFAGKLLKERYEQINREILSVNDQFIVSFPEMAKSDTLDFSTAFDNQDHKYFGPALKLFKNPKAFFEKNEKKFMEEALEQLLSPLADQYLTDGLTRINKHYQAFLTSQFNDLTISIKEDLNGQISAWLIAFEDNDKMDDWKEIQRSLESDDHLS